MTAADIDDSIKRKHIRVSLKNTGRQSATTEARDMMPFGEKARIPTTQERSVIPRLEKLFTTWKNLQKRAKTPSETRQKKGSAFSEELCKLFDIAHANAMEMAIIEEDR